MLLLAADVAKAGNDNTAAWLAFVGALFVAVVAALTAELRQRKSLAAEGERHAAIIAAEAARNQATLDHDRLMRELDEVRMVFDSVTERLGALTDAYASLGAGLTVYRERSAEPHISLDLALSAAPRSSRGAETSA